MEVKCCRAAEVVPMYAMLPSATRHTLGGGGGLVSVPLHYKAQSVSVGISIGV